MKLLVIILMGAAIGRPQNDPVFRSGVSLVRVDAEAVDTGGRIIAGLTKDDFRVLDEGSAQTLVNFSFAEEPLDLMLLFDTSGSMRAKLLNVVRATELGFNELHRGDRVSVRAFSRASSEILPFTDNLQMVNEAILVQVLRLQFSGRSGLEAAADEAARRFLNEPKTQRKRAVLIVTDKAGAREPNEAAVVHDLWRADAVVNELILDRSQGATDAIVGKTGGVTIAARDPGEAFRDSVQYLRSGYAMFYVFPGGSTGAERRLEVELTQEASKRLPTVRIHARPGYVAP